MKPSVNQKIARLSRDIEKKLRKSGAPMSVMELGRIFPMRAKLVPEALQRLYLRNAICFDEAGRQTARRWKISSEPPDPTKSEGLTAQMMRQTEDLMKEMLETSKTDGNRLSDLIKDLRAENDVLKKQFEQLGVESVRKIQASTAYGKFVNNDERVGGAINHPTHYTHPSGVECIDVVEWMSFNVGNAVKYAWRAGRKGSTIEDLKKSRWYLSREIERLEKEAQKKP